VIANATSAAQVTDGPVDTNDVETLDVEGSAKPRTLGANTYVAEGADPDRNRHRYGAINLISTLVGCVIWHPADHHAVLSDAEAVVRCTGVVAEGPAYEHITPGFAAIGGV
jgi:hypothetical protein